MSLFYRDFDIQTMPNYLNDRKESKEDKKFPIRRCPKCKEIFDKSATNKKNNPGYYYLGKDFPVFHPIEELCMRCKNEL